MLGSSDTASFADELEVCNQLDDLDEELWAGLDVDDNDVCAEEDDEDNQLDDLDEELWVELDVDDNDDCVESEEDDEDKSLVAVDEDWTDATADDELL